MASPPFSSSPPALPLRHHSVSLHLSFPSLFPRFPTTSRSLPLRAFADGADQHPAPPSKPLSLSLVDMLEGEGKGKEEDGTRGAGHEGERRPFMGRRIKRWWDPDWGAYEDRILEDTVPLVGFVRMILHSGRYESGERLSSEHEKAIIDGFLMHHPEYDKKIGCGIDYITIGYHPDFERSRCLFIVRKDGELIDFSYWKCIKNFIKKKYPSHADAFILRHFRRRRHSD